MYLFALTGTVYIEMADLLRDFDNPSVMDIKMGTRLDELTLECTSNPLSLSLSLSLSQGLI